jgi:(6-4)DNA photolyase
VIAQAGRVPLNSLEGVVRQVIGWREFVRLVYLTRGRGQRTRNFWGFTRDIPAAFYDGGTGIGPVDHVIRRVLRTGYCHHIERLMILGNFSCYATSTRTPFIAGSWSCSSTPMTG